MKQLRNVAIAMLGSVSLCLAAVGCAAEKHEAIPGDAKLVAKGQTDVVYRAAQPGTVYVYDRSTGEMVYSGRVRENDVVAVDAMKDRVVLNSTPVNEKKIKDFYEIKIYFEQAPGASLIEARPADATIIREREIQRSSTSTQDGTVIVRPKGDSVTVDGAADSKVTVEPSNSDSKVTIERAPEGQR